MRKGGLRWRHESERTCKLQKCPEEGKAGKQDEFRLRPTFDAIERELISLVDATFQEIGRQEIESPTKADEYMLLPLAQKMGRIIGYSSKQIRTELMEGLGSRW